MHLSQLTPKEWETALKKALWEAVSSHVFDSIYFPAAQTKDAGTFNTAADIRLKLWVEKILPQTSLEVGWSTLKLALQDLMAKNKQTNKSDQLFDPLREKVLQELVERHQWDSKSIETLRLIQLNALEDRLVHDKYQWDASVQFMEAVLRDKFVEVSTRLYETIGPGFYEQWLYWKRRSPEQWVKVAIKNELESMFMTNPEAFFKVCTALSEGISCVFSDWFQ